MSKIKCIVIEDEPLAVKVLTDYILQVPFLELQETFRNALLATDYLRDNSTELIFLDIHLPKLKGMSFLKTLTCAFRSKYTRYFGESIPLNPAILFIQN